MSFLKKILNSTKSQSGGYEILFEGLLLTEFKGMLDGFNEVKKALDKLSKYVENEINSKRKISEPLKNSVSRITFHYDTENLPLIAYKASDLTSTYREIAGIDALKIQVECAKYNNGFSWANKGYSTCIFRKDNNSSSTYGPTKKGVGQILSHIEEEKKFIGRLEKSALNAYGKEFSRVNPNKRDLV